MDTEGIFKKHSAFFALKSSFDAITSFEMIYQPSVTSECLMITMNQSMLLHPQTDIQCSKTNFLFFFFFIQQQGVQHSFPVCETDGERQVYNRSQY